MKANRHGFTLIELLVVIAIIAILAAILFPVFTSARKSAQYTKCLGNMKQLGAAMQMYRDDYNGKYPYYLLGLKRDDLPLGRSRMLEAYTKNMGVFICPTDPTRGGVARPFEQWELFTEFPRTSQPDAPEECSYLYWASASFQGKRGPCHGRSDWVQWMSSRVGSKLVLVTCEWHIVDGGIAGKLNSEKDSGAIAMPSLRADGSVQRLRWNVNDYGDAGWHWLEYGIYGK
jgi:prepilin-type N-terminal cleavage/methylation domain-containing protein